MGLGIFVGVKQKFTKPETTVGSVEYPGNVVESSSTVELSKEEMVSDFLWESNTANWDWFYVSEDMSVIYWQDIVEGEYYSLEDWRKSESYRNL